MVPSSDESRKQEMTTWSRNKSPNTNEFLTDFRFPSCRLFVTFRKTIYFISAQLKRRQPISILVSQHFIVLCRISLSTCHFSPKISPSLFVGVSVCRRRQLKESVYGDKLPQYNNGGGMTSAVASAAFLHPPHF